MKPNGRSWLKPKVLPKPNDRELREILVNLSGEIYPPARGFHPAT